MAHINLLPWRDEYRQEKKKEFFTILAGFCILGALCGYVWVSTVQGSIDDQNARNKRLQDEIALLQKQVAEIQELKKRRTELIARMEVIQGLQGTRPVIVRYFDELVRAVPDGVYIKTLNRQGDSFRLEGVGESPNRISALMRNFENSQWFATPSISSLQAAPSEGEEAQSFRMTVLAVTPKQDGENGG